MPGFNGIGPAGMGPMTGGGRGFCAVPLSGARPLGFGRGFFGRGRGFFGRGGGSGRRNWYYATGLPGWARAGYGMGGYGTFYEDPYASGMTSQQEADMLKEQAKAMQDEIASINERIATLEKATAEEEKK